MIEARSQVTACRISYITFIYNCLCLHDILSKMDEIGIGRADGTANENITVLYVWIIAEWALQRKQHIFEALIKKFRTTVTCHYSFIYFYSLF